MIKAYDKTVSFDLPVGTAFEETTDDKGCRIVKIKLPNDPNAANPLLEEMLNKKHTFSVYYLETTGASPLESVKSQYTECLNMLPGSTPRSLLSVRIQTPESGFCGQSAQLSIELPGNKALAISCFAFDTGSMFSAVMSVFNLQTNKQDDPADTIRKILEQLHTIWGCMRINGKRVATSEFDMEAITEYVYSKYNGEDDDEDYDEDEDDDDDGDYDDDDDDDSGTEPLDNSVSIEDGYVTIGNRWKMELPSGVRAQWSERGEGELCDLLSFRLGSLYIGSCLLGRSVSDQFAVFPETDRLRENMLYSIQLREDARMSVLMLVCTNDSSFRIIVTEPEQSLYTYIELNCPYDETIDIVSGLSRLRNRIPFEGHPFGRQWEKFCSIALRMAASISLIDEQARHCSLSRAAEYCDGIKVSLPVGMQFITKPDGTKLCVPAGKPFRSENEKTDYPYHIQISKLKLNYSGMQKTTPGHMVNRHKYDTDIRNSTSPLSVSVREYFSDNAAKALRIANSNSGCTFEIIALTTWGDALQIVLFPGNDCDLTELRSTANDIYESLVLKGDDGSCIPAAFPSAGEKYMEHYLLISGGKYTTARDADFVGQSVLKLLEKNGKRKSEAYSLIQIANDDYTLDRTAEKLAEVFRLKEDLFDPRSDTEAMIRLGMFRNVSMLHVLRSLAWAVMCDADSNKRSPDSYTFAELERFAAFIAGKRNVVYGDRSYCPGLCSCYDWHVFYVPESYFDTGCFDESDLRELCGKTKYSGQECGDTIESLEALRYDLEALLPVMQTINNGLNQNRDKSRKPEGLLADALAAWCALAVAAKEPFYSEEANNEPDVQAGLNGPLARPYAVQGHADGMQAGNSSAKTAASTAETAELNANCAAGDYVTFGRYPQTASGKDETPVEWLVLAREGNRALLISRYALFCMLYHLEGYASWETCYLREELNTRFFHKAFNEKERSMIATSVIDNSPAQCNKSWYTLGEKNTKDKVFLLSYAEAHLYFSNKGSGTSAATDYAVSKGAFTFKKTDGTDYSRWWLRSPGKTLYSAAAFSYNMGGYADSADKTSGDYCVRPAMWVYLDSKCHDEEPWSAPAKQTSLDAEFAIGSRIAFGTYPQTEKGTDTTPVIWRVLARKGSEALIISEYALDNIIKALCVTYCGMFTDTAAPGYPLYFPTDDKELVEAECNNGENVELLTIYVATQRVNNTFDSEWLKAKGVQLHNSVVRMYKKIRNAYQ